jgi:hypothetical protein
MKQKVHHRAENNGHWPLLSATSTHYTSSFDDWLLNDNLSISVDTYQLVEVMVAGSIPVQVIN